MNTKAVIITIYVFALLLSACSKHNSRGPVVRSISPDNGHFYTRLTIRGSGFEAVNTVVTIDSVLASIQDLTDSTITVIVPVTHTAPVVVATAAGTGKGPVFTYTDDVLVAGELILNPGTSWGGQPQAYFWDNDIPYPLWTQFGTSANSATGIASSGNDIYVCGYQYYSQNRYAFVFKNGVEQDLSNKTTQDARPYGIQVSGQNVYVAGFLNNGMHDVATLWLNGSPTALAGDTVDSYATAILLAGNDVYVAGYRAQSTSANHVAVYWKNGTAINLSDGSADVIANGIAFAGSDLYVSGNSTGGVLWKNGTMQPLGYFTAGLSGFGNTLYVAGLSPGNSNLQAFGAASPGYDLGNLTVNGITSDNTGAFTANSGPAGVPSYSICTGAAAVTTVPLNTVNSYAIGNAWGICVRH